MPIWIGGDGRKPLGASGCMAIKVSHAKAVMPTP